MAEQWYHLGDPDLVPFSIPLPNPPEERFIDYYNLPKDEQYWRPPSLPRRLRELQKSNKSIKAINDFLRKNQGEYAMEIEFVRREWERRNNGYWLYINGVATWMPGWHYFYCGYWELDVGLPRYLDRDRKFFVFADYAYKTTKTIDGKEYERRVCMGFNYPKHRREGATYRAAEINYEINSKRFNSHGGIQSMDGKSGKRTFREKYVQPWKRLPFFFKPLYSGTTDPKEQMVFDVPAQHITKEGSIAVPEVGLQSFIDFADSASRSWYDGDKLHFYHDDETGKTKEEDVYIRQQVVSKCLTQDQRINIHGFYISTSTVGQMASGGGRNYYDLCQDSWQHDYDPITGQTKTGLWNLFMPAYEGNMMFIDKFGNSIVDDPDEETVSNWAQPIKGLDGTYIGSKTYLDGMFSSMLTGMEAREVERYNEELRQSPTKWRNCWGGAGSGNGLNIIKIGVRLEDLRMMPNAMRTVNMAWKDGVVVLVDDPNGRYNVSLILPPEETNRKVMRSVETDEGLQNWWYPEVRGRFTASADPYKFRKVNAHRESKGGGCVYWERDFNLDPPDKPMQQWESGRFVCTYLHRPATPEEYIDDMLKMCVYYGADMFPEINIPTVWDHFVVSGYGGYLKYEKDSVGRWMKTPGWYNSGNKPQALWNVVQSYIEMNCHREMHSDFLSQCFTIRGVDELTDYDLFTACGGALLGSRTDYKEMNPDRSYVDIAEIFPRRRY